MFPGLDTVQKKFDRIVSAFGDFARIKNVSKRAARIGLLLSTSKPVLHLTDAEIGETTANCAQRVAFCRGRRRCLIALSCQTRYMCAQRRTGNSAQS